MPVLKSLLLPKEHGSWSLAFEPVVLALLVAPSGTGAALAATVAGGFFTRRPLKLACTLPASDLRRASAAGLALAGAALALAALAVTAVIGGWRGLWPLLLAAPFGAAFLWFDLRNEMREAEAELAGSIAFALTPAAFATVAGWAPAPALALAGIMLARSVPTVLIVRAYLRINKGQAAAWFPPLAAATLALLLIVALGGRQLVPPAAAVLGVVFWLRGCWLVTSLRPAWTARRVGVLEAVLGTVHVGVLAVSYAGFPA
ncbi:MAG: YwiC-like family protein [Opitutae bacterium]|nr:YwiC-like family protein [Opitutae bacterium]